MTLTRSGAKLSREFLWAMLDAAPDGMVLVDGDGVIVLANSTAAELLGYEVDALSGRPVEELLPDRHRAEHAAHRQRYLSDPQLRPMGAGLRLAARRADGTELTVEVGLSPIRVDPGPVYVLAVLRDITERVRNEERLERSRRAMHDAELSLAVASERDRIAADLADSVIGDLFGAGIHLHGAMALADDSIRQRLHAVVAELDGAIRQIRSAVFSQQVLDTGAPDARRAGPPDSTGPAPQLG